VLLQVGVSVPIDTLTQPCIPVTAATYVCRVYYAVRRPYSVMTVYSINVYMYCATIPMIDNIRC